MISILPEEERDSAMEYYEDYFADSGPENEAQIIDEFGSPELVARQILLSSSVGNADSLDAMLAAAAAAAKIRLFIKVSSFAYFRSPPLRKRFLLLYPKVRKMASRHSGGTKKAPAIADAFWIYRDRVDR